MSSQHCVYFCSLFAPEKTASHDCCGSEQENNQNTEESSHGCSDSSCCNNILALKSDKQVEQPREIAFLPSLDASLLLTNLLNFPEDPALYASKIYKDVPSYTAKLIVFTAAPNAPPVA